MSFQIWKEPKKVFYTFLGIKDTESPVRRSVSTVTANILLRGLEWYFIVPIAFSIVIFLKFYEIGFWYITFILSVLNAFLSFLIIYVNDVIGIDVTLMEGAGRVFDFLNQKVSKWKIFLNQALFLVFILWNLFYQGPAYVYLLLRKRNFVQRNGILLIIIMSFLQMFPWTFFYLLGYEGLKKVFLTNLGKF